MSIDAKEFSTTSIQKHLEDFGLDAEFSTHSAIRGLSGKSLSRPLSIPCTEWPGLDGLEWPEWPGLGLC